MFNEEVLPIEKYPDRKNVFKLFSIHLYKKNVSLFSNGTRGCRVWNWSSLKWEEIENNPGGKKEKKVSIFIKNLDIQWKKKDRYTEKQTNKV